MDSNRTAQASTVKVVPVGTSKTVTTIIPTTTTSTTATTEYFQWCITWTLAYPCIASHWLIQPSSSTIFNDDHSGYSDINIANVQSYDSGNESLNNTHQNCDTCNDDYLWLSYIAFQCVWNETRSRIYHRLGHGGSGNETDKTEKAPVTATPTAVEAKCYTRWNDSLGYGEITEMAVFQILHYLNTRVLRTTDQNYHHGIHYNDSHHPHIRTVMDLGSGTGRVVLATAMAMQYHHPRPPLPVVVKQPQQANNVVMGIEIVSSLHNQASQIVARWNVEQQLLVSSSSIILSDDSQPMAGDLIPSSSLSLLPPLAPWFVPAAATQLDIRCGDFLENYHIWIQSVDVIFIHGTVFEDELWEHIYHMILGTRSNHFWNDVPLEENGRNGARIGTYIVSVSRPLTLPSLHLPNPKRHDCLSHKSQSTPATAEMSLGINGPCRHDNDDNGTKVLDLQYISEFDVDMSWGRGIIYIQRVASATVSNPNS
jgi:hypothetical protein